MGWLKKLLGNRGTAPGTAIDDAPECEHLTLVPRWDSNQDIGRVELASAFRCEACGQTFTPAEAASLRATEAARLRRKVS